ncbi:MULTISPECIES: cytochrome P450 [unclassified Streptosporangium]|uniref:cytochrome P450 n=1 Tax=unclassified Streptosporangium TaxID=2632669 RepID=UPI002E2B8B78|nr:MULTISPECIES: cytochrome P450 [unclassified Streptosporangium]
MRFDPWNPEFVAHPYDVYDELRRERPVSFFEPTGQWLVARHADVNALLRDRRLGRSYLHVASHREFGRPDDPEFQDPFWRVIRAGMLDVEPPVHTRLRRLVSKAFTPRMVQALRPKVARMAEELVDVFVERGGGDLIAEVAEPLPVTVIAEMLGVPEADRHLLRPWSADICGMYELQPSVEAQRTAVRAAEEFSAYLVELARARRADPGDDLISALALVADEGDTLTEEELVGTCVLLLNAGHEATVNVTGNGWWSLFRNPAELDRLRADHTLLPTAVEELMRWDTPLQMFERWVLEDISVGGIDIPRGTEVALLFGSANRDPEVFADPARLDVGRVDNPHISFGAGIHFCLGAPLARVELIESFGALLRKAPKMELVAEPSWGPGYVIRGLESLQIRV